MKLIENNISDEDIGKLIKDGSSGWIGTETYELLVYKYIMDFHKNDCIPIINTSNNKKELLVLWIMDDSFKNMTKKIINDKTYNFVDIKWFWNPEDKWIDKKENTNNNYGEIKKTFDSLKQCSKRFVPLYVRLDFSNISHANMIILDLKKKTAEHFEPHGFRLDVNLENDDYYKIYINDVLRIQLPLLFKDLGFEYIAPIKTCPSEGLQAMQTQYANMNLYSIFKDEYGLLYSKNNGLCVLFSFILLDLRLSNEKYTTHQIMNRLLNIKNRKNIFLSHKNNDIYNKIYNISEKNYKNNTGGLIYIYSLIFIEKVYKKNIPLFMKFLQEFETKYKMKGLVKYIETQNINPFKMLNSYTNYNIKIELNNVDNPLDIYGFDLVNYMMKKIETKIFNELLNMSSIKLVKNNNKYIDETYIIDKKILKLEEELEKEKEYDYIYNIKNDLTDNSMISISTILKNLVILSVMSYSVYI